MYLAADVGGTKVLLSAFTLSTSACSESCHFSQSDIQVVAQAEYASAEFDSLEACVQAFQTQFQLSPFKAACFGLPAPITQFPLSLTNLDWIIDPSRLKRICHIEQLYLLNDFTAAAWGVVELCHKNTVMASLPLVALQQVAPDRALSSECCCSVEQRLVVGAGTGLGVAPIVAWGEQVQPLASEGGHMDFAPTQMWQQNLLSFLWQSWSHVSYERILSGVGLLKLYQFWQAEHGGEDDQSLSPENISMYASEGEPVAVKTLQSFVSIYGSYIGNLGLFWQAKGGIFIAGGIASKILPWMQSSHFLTALHAKGRMSALTQQWPVWVVTDVTLGLKGAMFYLRQKIKEEGK